MVPDVLFSSLVIAVLPKVSAIVLGSPVNLRSLRLARASSPTLCVTRVKCKFWLPCSFFAFCHFRGRSQKSVPEFYGRSRESGRNYAEARSLILTSINVEIRSPQNLPV